MAGGVSSLNVSTAGAVVLYEASRQRRAKALRSESADDRRAGAASGAKPSKGKHQKGLGS